MSYLNEFQARVLASASAVISGWPATRFFEPNGRFFEFMDQYKDKFICDCGSGSGWVPHSLRVLGHDADGIDLYSREDGYPVTIKDATEREWRTTDIVLVCRPSHSGWAGDVIQSAIQAGAMVAYVGLHRNIHIDLDLDQINSVDLVITDVGSEGEFMYCWGTGFDDAKVPSSAASMPEDD